MKLKIRGAAVRAAIAIAVACTCAGSAYATTVNTFDNAADLQGSNLALNRDGIRYKAIFKVYDMAMYLPRKAKTAEDVLAMPGPKKLSFIALRDVPGTDLGLTFVKGLSSNSSPEQIQKFSVASTSLIEIFSGQANCRPVIPSPWSSCPAKHHLLFPGPTPRRTLGRCRIFRDDFENLAWPRTGGLQTQGRAFAIFLSFT